MRVDISTDRRLDLRPDPVARASGVFSAIEPHELSEAEALRLGTQLEEAEGEEADVASSHAASPSPGLGERIWSPAAVLARVTALYARLKRPSAVSQSTPSAPLSPTRKD